MCDVLRADLVEFPRDRIQSAQAPQSDPGEDQPEYGAHCREHSGFHQVLDEDLVPAGPQGAADAGEGGTVEILGQQ